MLRRTASCVIGLVLFVHVGTGPAGATEPPQPNLVYEIFVRSFADSAADGDTVGDLKGIAEKLDSYLNDGDPATDHDLEVGILWLMPVFPASSYHGYDVTNFRDINPEYGTLDDFRALLAEAHRRGVRVILDVPFNHTSNDHPWFREAVDDPSSRFRNFYHIEPDRGQGGAWHSITSASGERLRYLGVFSSRMPDLNFDNHEVRQAVKEIAAFWLDLGVDGFRLDAAKHIYGPNLDTLHEPDILHNNDWWREFSHAVYSSHPSAVLVGEVLGNREILRRHAWGLDALIDEPYMDELRRQVGWPAPEFVTRYKRFVDAARALNDTAYDTTFPFPDQRFQSFTYAASHDRNPRLASELEQMQSHGMPHSVDEAYRLAVYMLLTIARHPILYAGDEVMQRGWKWNGNPPDHPNAPGDGSGVYDETLREPFPWFRTGAGPGQAAWRTDFLPKFDAPNDGVSVEEQAVEGGMLHLVRGLTNLRTKHPTLADGDIGAILSDSDDWMVFEKVDSDDRYLVLINLTAHGNSYRFHTAWFPQYVGAQLIFWSDGHIKQWRDTSGEDLHIGDAVYVPPFGLVVLRERAS